MRRLVFLYFLHFSKKRNFICYQLILGSEVRCLELIDVKFRVCYGYLLWFSTLFKNMVSSSLFSPCQKLTQRDTTDKVLASTVSDLCFHSWQYDVCFRTSTVFCKTSYRKNKSKQDERNNFCYRNKTYCQLWKKKDWAAPAWEQNGVVKIKVLILQIKECMKSNEKAPGNLLRTGRKIIQPGWIQNISFYITDAKNKTKGKTHCHKNTLLFIIFKNVFTVFTVHKCLRWSI